MKNRGFDFGDFEITKREILASISIIAMMLLVGFVISGRISNYILDRNEKYKIIELDFWKRWRMLIFAWNFLSPFLILHQKSYKKLWTLNYKEKGINRDE